MINRKRYRLCLRTAIVVVTVSLAGTGYGQTTLSQLLDSIEYSNPSLRMYDYDIRSMEEAAKGARSWMPPEVGAGFFMTPYNPKYIKGMEDDMGNTEPGMGQFMISAQQMLPNRRKQNAEAAYMNAMPRVERERRLNTLNQLRADIKKNYFQWAIELRKLRVLEENEKLLQFMIQSAELRYKNGLDKISAYYKAKAAQGNVQTMRVMTENEIEQRRITINTILNRDKSMKFNIDTTIQLRDYGNYQIDTAEIAVSRSDIRAIDRDIQLNDLRISSEKAKLLPEFGIKYDHMIGLAQQPAQFTLMGMMRVPIAPWSSRMNKANIESYKWRTQSLQQQRQMLLNEATGMTQGMLKELQARQKQIALYEQKIIPALRNNYATFQIAYEQNTEELFMLFDAWETLNMTQIEYLNTLKELFNTQVELERILELNN
ncbi:TolC family protein [Polluticoccus soli]|uniref:TolC family protein n=1 Tax=Polluticoccus soli TaxID=3034150 RepID=UPI0023E17B9D|nr:TolC family protein [Flavipsychrobacter sp. JY13-12]